MLAEMGLESAATAGIFRSMLVYAVVASGVGAALTGGPRRVFPVAAVLLGRVFPL
jgi:hypothetical protein